VIAELLHRIEQSPAVDTLADRAEKARPLLRREPVSRVLSGAWLGHRLHPMLTDLVIGAWTSASLLDVLGGRSARPAARRLVGIGIAAYAPTATTGLHDVLDYGEKVRRTGAVHAMTNAVGLGFQVASWVARGRGRHTRGTWLSLAGMAVTGAGGYLGGHLTYVLGAGVERTAFDDGPEDWTATVPASELVQGQPRAVDAGGTAVLLVLDGAHVRALADTCNHAGCSLAAGEVEGGAVTCGCHGSRFSLADGVTLAGPAAAAQPRFDTRVRDGMVEVREHRAASTG
jgi:nitrite reductase/ring-hydroxylating ferredoxin subunit/uncharacterized membrane protein